MRRSVVSDVQSGQTVSFKSSTAAFSFGVAADIFETLRLQPTYLPGIAVLSPPILIQKSGDGTRVDMDMALER
jgi:hypothetical protein